MKSYKLFLLLMLLLLSTRLVKANENQPCGIDLGEYAFGSLLGYWDFEGGSTTDAEGFMLADNGTIKATMYKIQQAEGGISSGSEIQPFTYGKGVNPESVLQGIEENIISDNKTKAYIANGVLNIENEGGITSIEVYNSLGTPLYLRGAGGEETSIQIQLSSTIKGIIIVKVNNEVVKVICN